VGHANLAGRGQGAAGLARLGGQQAVAVGRLEQALVNLALIEGASGDQVVEVAGRLPQLGVAATHPGPGDAGQLGGQGRPGIARARPLPQADLELHHTGTGRPLAAVAFQLGPQ
jgi:hypothetical protein